MGMYDISDVRVIRTTDDIDEMQLMRATISALNQRVNEQDKLISELKQTVEYWRDQCVLLKAEHEHLLKENEQLKKENQQLRMENEELKRM